MIAVLVTLAILILFQVLYFTYCNLTFKGDEDGIKVSYLENHKFVNKFAKEFSELDIAIINSIFLRCRHFTGQIERFTWYLKESHPKTFPKAEGSWDHKTRRLSSWRMLESCDRISHKSTQ